MSISIFLFAPHFLVASSLRAELLDATRQQCHFIQDECARVLCNPSEESRTRLSLFLDAQESTIRGLQAELLARVPRAEVDILRQQIDSLHQSSLLSQVILPQEEAVVYSRIDALEQHISVLQAKLDARDRLELEAMSNQLAYDFKLLRILSHPPRISRGEIVRELKLHQNGVSAISVSADSSRAVSVGKRGKALVWDTRTGELITDFRGHGGAYIFGVSLSADGSRAVSVDNDGKSLVWDTRTGVQVTEFRAHRVNFLYSVSLSADGRRAVSVGEEGIALVWDTRTGVQITEFRGQGGSEIYSVSLSANGSTAVSVGYDGKALVWDTRTGDQIAEFRGHGGLLITSVGLSADASRAVSVGNGGKALVWDTRTGKQITEFRAHRGVTIVSASLSIDGSRALSVGKRGKALVWDTRTGELIRAYPEQDSLIRSAVWDQIHGRFYFGLDDGRILVGE